MKDLEKQFLQAYDQFSDAIFRHCYFRVFNRERAKELVQDCFMKTWEYLAKGEKVDNLRAFLYRVANNLIIDNSRKRKEASLDQMVEEGFEPAGETKDRLIGFLEGKEAIRLLERLSPAYRQVVQMRYLDDLDIKEIAGIIGESENNVSVKLHRAVKQLREILEYS